MSDDDVLPPLLPDSEDDSCQTYDEDLPALTSCSDSDEVPDLVEELRGDAEQDDAPTVAATDAPPPSPAIASLDRLSAPYVSHPVGMKEEGPAALRRKQGQSLVPAPAGAIAYVDGVQCEQHKVTETKTDADIEANIREKSAAAALRETQSQAQPVTRTAVVAQDAFAKFKEKELENLKRLRKERGLADSESMSEMVIARCHLRPGAPGSKLCEHDSSFFSLRCADRRIVVECTKGCRMLYHFPNCWRRVVKAYKEDVDPSWIGWSKGKEPQLVPCITDQCCGFITSAVVVEGAPGEEVAEIQYQLPKELADQLERQRQQDAEQAAKAKVELLQKQQEENRAQRRRRKAEAAAAKRAAKQVGIISASASGRTSPTPAAPAAAAVKATAARVTDAPKQPAIKIYNKGAVTVASNASAAKAAAVSSPWAPEEPAAPQPPAAEASDPDFPSLSASAQGGKPKAPAPKKKPKMLPVDPRALGFASADGAPATKYEEYYEEVEDSEDYAYDRELQELDRKYPHFERDDYGNPLYPDNIYTGLDRLRLDPDMPAVSNHLLVEYLDIAKLVQVTNLNVDKFLREKFSSWGGSVSHFRIFTRQEAAAISFATVDQACVAWVRMEGKKLYRNYLNISFLQDFPNDVALKRVVPTYQPRNQHNMRIEKSICYVKYLPTDMLREMAEAEETLSSSEVMAVLRQYEWRRIDDASEYGIPDPDDRALEALTTRRPFVPPARRQQQQQQQSTEQLAEEQWAPPPGQQVQQRSTLGSQASSGSESTAFDQSEASEAAIDGSDSDAGDEEEAAGADGTAAGAASHPVHQQSPQAQLPAQAGPSLAAPGVAMPGFELLFDVVQVLGCKSDHLQNHYRRYSAFKLEHRFFCDPHRIGAGPQERTALVLCNIDTGRLEGLWQATTNNGREIDFKPVATVPALPFETYAPVLPPNMLQTAAANTPLKIPARLDGQHARQVLAAFSRAAAAAGMGPVAVPVAAPATAAPLAATTSAAPEAAAAPAVAPRPHTIAAAAAAAAKRPSALQPVVPPPAASLVTTPRQTSPMVSPSATPPAPPPSSVAPLMATAAAVAAAAPAPLVRPAYNPLVPLQAPPAAAPTGAAAPPRSVANLFPFFMGAPGAPNPRALANPAATRPAVIQPLTVVTPMARPPVAVTPLAPLQPADRPVAPPARPFAPLPFFRPAATPAAAAPAVIPPQPVVAAPAADSTSPEGSPSPSPAPSPTPAAPTPLGATTPAATPSPVPSKKVRNPCALCGVKRALYLHVQCVKFGPCADCLPDKSQLASVYPVCRHCRKPTTDADIVKVHR